MPTRSGSPRVLIVGAGVAGLSAAQSLANSGFEIVIVDKGRAPGGRISSRESEAGTFDHGAQYFTVRDRRFQARVDAWLAAGVAAPWTGRFGVAEQGDLTAKTGDQPARYVGVPSMRSIAVHQGRMLDVRNGVSVIGLSRADGLWRATVDAGEAPPAAHAVLVTAPSEQTRALLEPAPALAAAAGRVRHAPCWAVMVAFASPVDIPFDGLFVHDSALSWVARDSAKPGRGDGERWVLHAGPTWSEAHIEDDAAGVADALVGEFIRAIGRGPLKPVHLVAHRWRYALAEPPIDRGCLFDDELRIGAAGDWLHGARIEGAYLSGLVAASRVREALP